MSTFAARARLAAAQRRRPSGAFSGAGSFGCGAMSPTIARAVERELSKHRAAEDEERRLETRASELRVRGAALLAAADKAAATDGPPSDGGDADDDGDDDDGDGDDGGFDVRRMTEDEFAALLAWMWRDERGEDGDDATGVRWFSKAAPGILQARSAAQRRFFFALLSGGSRQPRIINSRISIRGYSQCDPA